MKAIRPGLAFALLTGLTTAPAATPDFRSRSCDFPDYKVAPSGRQMTGQHAPDSTPAPTPDEALKKFVVPEGCAIRLFAAYGFNAKKDLLARLLALNQQIAAKIEKGEPAMSPAVPRT